MTTGTRFGCKNETGEILGILFNASGYCSPSVGVAHEAGVRCGRTTELGTPGVEHADGGPADAIL